MRPPEKPHGIDYFIDRPNYTRAFRNFIKAEDLLYVIGDTNATYGSGKTTILGKLYADLLEDEEGNTRDALHPIWMSLSLFSTLHRNPQIQEEPNTLEVLAQNIHDYYDLLSEVSQDELPEPEKVAASMREIGLRPLDKLSRFDDSLKIDMSGDMDQWQAALRSVSGARIAHNPTIPEAAFRSAVADAARTMTDYFLKHFNPLHSSRRNVVFADDYCWISYQPIGDWVLNRLGKGMQNSILLVSHTQGEVDLPKDAKDQQKLRLSNFTPEEVGEYLEKRLTTDERSGAELLRLNPDLVTLVYEFANQGHSQTVCLVADLLRYVGIDEGMELVKTSSAAVSPAETLNTEETMAKIVQKAASKLSKSVKPLWLRYAMRLGAVLRRFDGQLMVELLCRGSADFNDAYGAQDEHGNSAGVAAIPASDRLKLDREVIKILERYSFVDYYRKESGPYYAFHFFVAEQLTEMLKLSEAEGGLPLLNPKDGYPADFHGLHQLAHEYYQGIMEGYEDQEESSTFVALHLYEDPHWQIVVGEWLYHFLSFKSDEQKEAELEFVRFYLQAFQWWGYYLPFPFCDRLLTEWQSTKLDTPYPAIELLREFHEVYPLGTPKKKMHDARWTRVREILEAIIDYFEIMDCESLELRPELNEKETNLLVNLMEIYAGCFRFAKEPDYDRAEAIYELETELAPAEENEFNASYAHAYEAEMQIERARYEEERNNRAEAERYYHEAEANARRGLDDVGKAPRPFKLKLDYEVISLCWRMIGEVALVERRYADAAEAFLNASQFVYVYNFYQAPLPPDPYTLQWNRDMNADIAESLMNAWKLTQDEAIIRVVQHLFQSRVVYDQHLEKPSETHDFHALMGTGNASKLAEALFIPPPPTAVAKTKDHLYLQNMINFSYKLLDSVQPYS